MEPKKAIEILKFEEHATLPPRGEDFWNAIELGIAALERVQDCQFHHCPLAVLALPGETQEETKRRRQ